MRSWIGIASSADGNKLVAIVQGGQIYTSVSGTTPGSAGALFGASDSAIELQYVGGGKFHILSHAGSITAE